MIAACTRTSSAKGAAPIGSTGIQVRAVSETSAAPPPSTIEVRELTPSDRQALRFIFEQLSPDSRQQRFLHPKAALSARELDELTQLDHWHHEAFIAWSTRPRTPIGVGRYVRGEDFDVAELAITVADRWQRRGVGTQLLLELRDRARRAGIRRFSIIAMWGNRGALRLAHQLGSCHLLCASDGVVRLECRCW